LHLCVLFRSGQRRGSPSREAVGDLD
jgi:hypothetical protein